MKTKGIKLIIYGSLAILSMVFAIGGNFWLPPQSYTYSGKVLLTQEQYNSFKQLLSSNKITINTLTIADIDYPTLVTFAIIDKNKDFPYGKESSNGNNFSFFGFIPFVIFFVLGILTIENEI